MKPIAPVITILVMLTGAAKAAEHPPTGVVEIFEMSGDFGTLIRTVSGIPRAKPNPAEEAVERWRASAEAFTPGFAASRGANGTESFKVRRVYEDDIGEAHVRLSQTIAGLPVVGTELIVHVNFETGKVFGVNGRFAIDRGLARAPRLAVGDAIASALRDDGLAAARVEGAAELTYIVDRQNAVRLAWTNFVSYPSANGMEVDRIYADALTGAAIVRHPQVRRAKNREIYNCLNQLPATLNNCLFVFGEGGSSSDPKAMAAYSNIGTAYDYFWDRFSRDSTNGGGIVLRQGIDFGPDTHANTGWFPIGAYTAIMYSDGVGSYVQPMGYSLDIVGHEFTHGVVYYEATLPHVDEHGAIDEGLADVFAVAIDAYRDGSPDWWIAEDVYSVNVANDAMRYLDDPARRTGQADYYPLRSFGDVHENAGITGLTFYLLSQGGSHPRRPSVSVAAQGIDKAERIFYRALAAYMTSSTTFYELEGQVLKAASSLYGYQSAAYNATADAWLAVGNHWEAYGHVNPPSGTNWYSASYVTQTTGIHTGRLTGSDYDLLLERWNGSTWTIQASSVTSAPKKQIEAYVSAGTFRWRVRPRVSGAAGFQMIWNHPR